MIEHIKQSGDHSDLKLNNRTYAIFITDIRDGDTLSIDPKRWQEIKDAIDKMIIDQQAYEDSLPLL